MKGLVRYNSFEELKASSESAHNDFDKAMERHNNWLSFMGSLRESDSNVKTSPKTDFSVRRELSYAV